MPDLVPFLATSATMPPHILNDIQLKLCLSESHTFTINLGNNQPNITPIICHMHGTATDLDALNFAIDEANAQPAEPLIKTIIFFNAHDLAYKGCKHICNLVSEAVQHRINFLHAEQTTL